MKQQRIVTGSVRYNSGTKNGKPYPLFKAQIFNSFTGKQMNKEFSINKYGSKAKELAEQALRGFQEELRSKGATIGVKVLMNPPRVKQN